MEVAFCIQGGGPDTVWKPGGGAAAAKRVLPDSSLEWFDIKFTHKNVSKLNACMQQCINYSSIASSSMMLANQVNYCAYCNENKFFLYSHREINLLSRMWPSGSHVSFSSSFHLTR